MSHDIWSIILEIAVSVWIASFICFLFKAFPERGTFDGKSARYWGGISITAFIVWIVGLLNA